MRIAQLARSLVRCEKTSKDDMTMVIGSLLTAINKASSDLESEITDFNKTCEFMNFHPNEQEARTQEFLSIVNKLREMRMKNNSLLRDDDFLDELENQMALLGLV